MPPDVSFGRHFKRERDMKYLSSIDGLRAIAVIAVIWFHISPRTLPGGYLGVDIFFVISGYLIYRIIDSDIKKNTFSIIQFMARRAHRLLPALFVTVIGVQVVSILLIPGANKSLTGMHGVAAMFSGSNIFLWIKTGGYWDTGSSFLPLLHTWSLSLEAQFYVLMSLGMVAIHKSIRFSAIVVLVLGSMLAGLIVNQFHERSGFYLLPFRIWELLFGCVVGSVVNDAYLKGVSYYISRQLTVVGLALIVIVCLLADKMYSGLYICEMLACLGTGIFLLMAEFHDSAGGEAFWKSNILAKGMIYVGSISYSLYLWHWPVIVVFKYLKADLGVVAVVLELGVILLIGVVSYYVVECRFRMHSKNPRWIAMGFLGVIACGSCILTMKVHSSWFWRSSVASTIDLAGNGDVGSDFEATKAILVKKKSLVVMDGGPSATEISFSGSSHARTLISAFLETSGNEGWTLKSLASSGVGMTTDNVKSRPFAEILNVNRMQIIGADPPDIMIVAGKWSGELDDEKLNRLCGQITGFCKIVPNVILCLQVPEINCELPLPAAITSNYLNCRDDNLLPVTDKWKYWHGRMMSELVSIKQPNLYVVDLSVPFYETESNKSNFAPSGIVAYSDNDHLNAYGSLLVAQKVLIPCVRYILNPTQKYDYYGVVSQQGDSTEPAANAFPASQPFVPPAH